MLTTAMIIIGSLLIGWATPQPAWAKYVTDKITKKWNSLRTK